VAPENVALVKPDGKPVRALVVDDEPAISELVSMALRYEKFEVRTAASGQAAVAEAKDFRPDIIVLDIMLPDFDGLEVMRRIRADNADVPVLFLTAKDSVADRVVGLTAGGDDYVTKPFSVEELVARIRGIVRRSILASEAREDPEIVVGDLILNEETYEVFRGDARVELTATEFELLRYLMRNPKRVLSKAQILDRVWSYDFGGRSSIVEIYISYLRKKIDTLGPAMIHTVRGVGYVLRPVD
jgi:two-component system OmpR family response regulator